MTFKTHGPRIINGIEVWAVIEGENDVWCFCPTEFRAKFICELLTEYKNEKQYSESDFDRRFNDSWKNDNFKCCHNCSMSMKLTYCVPYRECWHGYNI